MQGPMWAAIPILLLGDVTLWLDTIRDCTWRGLGAWTVVL